MQQSGCFFGEGTVFGKTLLTQALVDAWTNFLRLICSSGCYCTPVSRIWPILLRKNYRVKGPATIVRGTYMAKGNDGNYFQHSLELSLALQLSNLHKDHRLNVALTHGMDPYEPCGDIPNGQARRLFDGALADAQRNNNPTNSVLVEAYRRTGASREHYPNTGELLAAMIGRDRLAGTITEVNTKKHVALLNAWQNSRVRPVNSSWRREVSEGGAFWQAPEYPWLFSMDPMTYCNDGYRDDDRIYRADHSRISPLLRHYVATELPGVAILFVFAVQPDKRIPFWDFAEAVAKDTNMVMGTYWITHQGGNRNLAAVLSSRLELRTDLLPYGLNSGRE